ncbi:hypothetical protein [Planococcus faecalis]|uniref:hypothetical protein n=1 Tax=Planococcus faecalis TaxID=1598147 RepID=UPI0008D90A2E|nr:hypothetical protein [Planococcus faecalis]OHX51637.1 hypothetical protein BB777_15810 [Planococcus faecalis]
MIDSIVEFLFVFATITLAMYILDKLFPATKISKSANVLFVIVIISYMTNFITTNLSNDSRPPFNDLVIFIVNLATLLGLYHILKENLGKGQEQKEEIKILQDEIEGLKIESAKLKKGTNINYYYH